MVSSLFNQSQTLSEPHRKKLDKIVSTLMDEGADDQSIQAVVNDYKKKYVGVRSKPKPMPGELTGGLDALPVGLSAKESAAESLKIGETKAKNYFENEAAKRKAKTLDATQTAKVLNDAAASIAGAFTDNPVTDALAKGKKLMAQTLGQGPANLAFGPGEKGLAGHVGGLIGGTVAAPFDIGADAVNFAGKGEWQAGVNILLKSGALVIPAGRVLKAGAKALSKTKVGIEFNAARGMKALIESGMDPVKAKQFVAKVTEEVKKPPVSTSEIPNISTPPGLSETVGAKRVSAENAPTPPKTPLKTVVLSDKEGKQFPAHASDFTDEDLLNQLDKKRQAARDIATHQPTNANGKATMHDVRELQAEVDRRGLGGSKDIGEPPKTPETATSREIGSTVSETVEPRTVAHADTESVLKDWGESLRESNPETINQWVEKAASSKRAPRDVAKEVLADPRPMTKEEQIQLGIRMNQIDEEVKAGVKDNIEEGVEIVRALDAAGSEWGRSGLSRQILLRTNYSEVALKARAEKVAPKGLNAKQVGLIEAQAKRIAELEKQIESRVPTIRSPRTREVIRAERATLTKQLLEQVGSLNTGAKPEALVTLAKIGVTYLEEGAVAAGDLVKHLKTEFGKHFSDAEIAKAARDAQGEHGRELNAGRQGYGEDMQVKGNAGLQDKQLARDRARLDLAKRDADALIEQFKPKSVVTKALNETAGVIRGVKLGFDLGALARQGLYGLTHPKAYGKAFIAGLKSLKSETDFAMAMRAIEEKQLPDGRFAAVLRKKGGVAQTGLVANNEEAFVSKIIKKIPGLGRVFQASERHMAGFLNALRAEMFDDFAAKFPDATSAELKQWGSYVNSVTGRSNLKDVPATLNAVFTSPRWTASRFEMIGQMVKAGASPKSKASQQIIKDTVTAVAGVYGALKAAQLAGADVDFNPTSTDFLKIRIGDTTYDPTASMGTTFRTVARIAVAHKEGYGKDIGSEIGKQVAYKVSPGIATPYEVATGKTLTGWDTDEQDKGWKAWAPLIVSQFMTNYEKEGTWKAIAKTAPELVGVNSGNYPKKNPN